MHGKFIVFDGIDGSGKTTQVFLAAEHIYRASKENRVLITREPTMEKHGLELRKLLSESSSTESTERVLDLFVKDRLFHLDTVIKPALERGHTVLCDRHKYSTLAYQAAGGADKDRVVELFRDFPRPDLALIFDVPAKKALERARGEETGSRTKPLHGIRLFEEGGFLEKTRQNFLACPRYFPREVIKVINADRAVESVFESAKSELDAVI